MSLFPETAALSPQIPFHAWQQAELDTVESALSAWVPSSAPAGLGQAMRYGVLDGGKRLRPLLVLAAAQAVAGHRDAALRAACAVELIHAYSLIHDDMPCMDDDVLRRGKPTVHVQFGEAQAMLAGDAMQALAFEVLTPDAGVPPALQAKLCSLLARSAGQGSRSGMPRPEALARIVSRAASWCSLVATISLPQRACATPRSAQ